MTSGLSPVEWDPDTSSKRQVLTMRHRNADEQLCIEPAFADQYHQRQAVFILWICSTYGER